MNTRSQLILWQTISHDVKQPKAHSRVPASAAHRQPANCELQSQWTSQMASEQMLQTLFQPAALQYSDLKHNNINNKYISAHTVKYMRM